MSTQLRTVTPNPQGPLEAITDREADAKYHWCAINDADALSLYHDMLKAVREPINGLAGRYADNGIEEHGRAQVRGDQHLRVLMVCRLLTATNPKALAAADAFLDVAAAARGKVVIDAADASKTAATLVELAQRMAKESGEATAALIAALESGDPASIHRAEKEAVESAQAHFGVITALRAMGGR